MEGEGDEAEQEEYRRGTVKTRKLAPAATGLNGLPAIAGLSNRLSSLLGRSANNGKPLSRVMNQIGDGAGLLEEGQRLEVEGAI